MLAQANTKKEYKKLMAEMLSPLDSESKDESSVSSIKTVDLADDTTSVTITRKDSLQEMMHEQERFPARKDEVNMKDSLQEIMREQEIFPARKDKKKKRQVNSSDPGISRLRCLMAFEDLSLSFETHFESLDFEFGNSIYDYFSENCASRISEQDYDENYEF
ncbi:hypothetical protein Godav_009776 [Gossypium davidsonii]|uniref:Uncharacterized protein n=1 Tax=Gossypium davidsonii TaxID=34287 RepID=A0A7J8SE72_GOSDV|nr:hypothetical protein [Gossypium davidsonii]